MVAAFTTPILSVAADAVRDLDGREALSGLWAVFTKCKGSLQNGPRLENIAWRLWHQEMKGSNRENLYLCEDRTLPEKDAYDEKSAYRPPTPSEILNLPPPYPELPSAPTAASSLPAKGLTSPPKPRPAPFAPTSASPPPLLTPTTPLHTRRLSSASNRRSSFVGGSPRSVGQIICDLLPALSSTSASNSSSSTNSSSSDLLMGASLTRKPLWHAPSISEPHPPSTKTSAVVPSIDGSRPSSISLSEVKTSLDANAASCLPTPEMEETELAANGSLQSSYSSQSPSIRAPQQAIPQSMLSDIPSSMLASDTFDTTVTSDASTTFTSDSASLSGQSSHRPHVLSEPLARFSDMDSLPSHTLSQFTPFVNILQPPTPTLPTAPQPSQAMDNLHTQPPRLVVVHPTPNPTPHPTPPTTPLINGVVPLAGHRVVFLSPPSMNGPPRQQAYTLLEEEFPSALNLPGLSGFSILDYAGAQSDAGFVSEAEEFDRLMVTNPQAATSAMGDYTLRPNNVLMDSSTSEIASLAALVASQGIAPAYTSDEMQRSPAKRDSSRKPRKRHSRSKSGSSIASRSSEVSHTTSHTSASNRSSISGVTATSTAFSSDVDPFTLSGQGLEKSADFADDSPRQLRDDLGGLDSATVAALKRLGSLSTIHSSSTLGTREDALQSVEGKEKDMQMVLVSDEEFDDEDDDPPTPLSPITPHESSTKAKKLKRNSAPPQLTSTTLAFSPTYSAQGNRSSSIARSTSTASSKRKARTVTSAAISRQPSNGRSSSRGRSTGGQEDVNAVNRSNLADLANLGIPGMTVVAAAYPPPVASTAGARKQLTVGGAVKAKSRAGKVVRARGVVRRNSAGPGIDLSGVVEPVVEVLEQKMPEGQKGQLERKLSQRIIQTGFEECTQVPPNDRRASEPLLQSQMSQPTVDDDPTTSTSATLADVEPLADRAIAASPEQIPTLADQPVPVQRAQTLAPSDQTSKPPHRVTGMFNIGSNSDEGKSAGSGSSISGAHSLGQRYTAMMEPQVPNGSKGDGRLVVDESKLKARLLQEEERQRREENEMRHHQQELMRQQQEVHLLQQQEIKLRNEAQLLALNQPRVLDKAEKRQLQMLQLFHNQQAQLTRASSKPPSRQVSTVHIAQPLVENERVSDRAKGKAKAIASPPPSKQKNKSKSTPNLANLDPDLAAKVRDSLAEPLLPKGRRVVVDTETEFETDSDDGSWSSAAPSDDNDIRKQEQYKRELSLQQEKVRQEAAGRLEQEQLVRQLLQHNERAQQVTAPPAIQRTLSAQLPATNQSKQGRSTNQRSRQAQGVHHAKLEQAAKEAQRQRDMIKKVPTESYQDLAQARANSVGLLSQLLNPNPGIFPPNHPYRRGYSQGNIRPTLQPIQPTASEPGPSRQPAPKSGPAPPPTAPVPATTSNSSKDDSSVLPALPKPRKSGPAPSNPNAPSAVQSSQHPRRHASTDDSRKRNSRSGLSSPIKAPPMPLMKSAAAMPVSSVVQAGSFAANHVSVASKTASGTNATMTSPGGYRPRGPPKDQEMDDDSGSEAEGGTIQLPKSVAEQRLKALAQKRGIRQPQTPQVPPGSSKQAIDDDVPEWARVSLPSKQHPSLTRRMPPGSQLSALAPHPPRTVPIPLGHPYNLPPPAPPTTPRTTRRQMLSTELSESLRRNLLWERQITKNGTVGMKRSASGGGSRHNVLNGVQPFTGMPRVVQLHAKGTVALEQQEDPSKPFNGVLATDQEREEMRKHAMARNRSWANDYHYAGW